MLNKFDVCTSAYCRFYGKEQQEKTYKTQIHATKYFMVNGVEI